MEALHTIYKELVTVAASGGTTYYSDVAPLAGLDMNSAADRNGISRVLDRISRGEHVDGRPLLSAVVVLMGENRPGKGFFTLARELGLHEEGADNDEYWANELSRVHWHWRST